MNNPTKEIIKSIANIQISSLTKLKSEVQSHELEFTFKELITKLLQINDSAEILSTIDNYLDFYINLETTPTLLGLLPEYQLLVCSHILFKMEGEWIISNQEGVFGAWRVIHQHLSRYHQEFVLI